MSESIEFTPFPKIGRLKRNVVITEKIDGTNAAIGVTPDGTVYAQSRKRLIKPGDDNFGFALWVSEREDELREGLGEGVHFGEWWGSGIQRGYGLTDGEKRFSLFNTPRWTRPDSGLPECCSVVPVLGIHTMDDAFIEHCLTDLTLNGSKAAPGFMDPEGIVVFHTATRTLSKVTIKGDDSGKEHGA